MTPEQREKFSELQRLLREAYQHWFDFSDDHHCKSSEGAVRIGYPNWHEQREHNLDPERADKVWVYSYVLGPNRGHDFIGYCDREGGTNPWFTRGDPFDLALAHVREWHAEELAMRYDETDE